MANEKCTHKNNLGDKNIMGYYTKVWNKLFRLQKLYQIIDKTIWNKKRTFVFVFKANINVQLLIDIGVPCIILMCIFTRCYK